MSSSDVVQPEQLENMATTNQSNSELNSHNVESVPTVKEEQLNTGEVGKPKIITNEQDDSTKNSDLDNRVTSPECQSSDAPHQNLTTDQNQTIGTELNLCTIIKTEPVDDVKKSSRSGTKTGNNLSSISLVAEYQSQYDTDDEDDESMDTNNKEKPEKEVEVIKEVTKDLKLAKAAAKVIDVDSSSSDTSDSSSDSSDSESDDSSTSVSSSSDEPEEQEQRNNSGKKLQQKQRENKAVPEELPTIEYPKLILPENVELTELGFVNSIIGQLVVVQSNQGVPALNIESVLFKENRQAIGAVYDVFGPVTNPLYSVVFNEATDISEQGITLKMSVFFAPHIKDVTAYVFTDKLRKEKGSDASWKDDEEPPVELIEYSDDEKEREAKHKKKEGKEGGRRRKKPQRRDRGNQEQRGGGERQHQQRGPRHQWHRNGPPHGNRPPYEGDNGQFGNNQFFHNQGPPPMPPPGPFGPMGNQFPPRLPPPGLSPHPPPHQGLVFPPRPPGGFMGGGPLPPPPPTPPMGFVNPNFGPGQWFKQEPPPFGGPPPGTQGPPFPNGDVDMKPMQDNSGGMFGNFSNLWQTPPPPPPPPPPPTGNFVPPGAPPGQNMPPSGGPPQPPPGFPSIPPFPYTTPTSSEGDV